MLEGLELERGMAVVPENWRMGETRVMFERSLVYSVAESLLLEVEGRDLEMELAELVGAL